MEMLVIGGTRPGKLECLELLAQFGQRKDDAEAGYSIWALALQCHAEEPAHTI